MPRIHIARQHSLSQSKAKSAVSKLAANISQKFAIQTQWQGETLQFERSGVSGEIALQPGRIDIQADLSFLLTPLKSRIEAEIENSLNEHFS
jgi:putative polyhydroxyalkanoate system protein